MLPRQPPRVTVVVVTWQGAHLLPPCLASLRAQTVPHAVLVVDNGSTDATSDVLAGFPEVEVLRLPTNTGFAGGAQAGLAASRTELTALLNNDAVADPTWLAALLQDLDADSSAVAVTSQVVLAANGRLNNAGTALTRVGVGYDRGLGEPVGPPYDQPADVAAFCGGAVLLRTAPVRAAGGFAEELFLYYEDTDLSWRLRREGHQIRYCPAARVVHEHSASSDQNGPLFAFYNQRNQLLLLVRNAPAAVAVRALLRFVVLTAVFLVRRPARQTADPRHRLRVLGAVLRMLPWALAQRRALERRATQSRRGFAREWLGTESRPVSGGAP